MHTLSVKHPHPGGRTAVLLPPREAQDLMLELDGWAMVEGRLLRREFEMKDFASAVEFIGAIAAAAEAEGHHPDLHLTGYRDLVIEVSTHEARGLTSKDFRLARRIDALPRELRHPGRPGAHRTGAANTWLHARRRSGAASPHHRR